MRVSLTCPARVGAPAVWGAAQQQRTYVTVDPLPAEAFDLWA